MILTVIKLFLIPGLLCSLFFSFSAHSQEYQKATQILNARVKQSTPLLYKAKPEARSNVILKAKSALVILGKKGNWLDVQNKSVRGWVSSFYVEVQGVANNQNTKPLKRVKAKSNSKKASQGQGNAKAIGAGKNQKPLKSSAATTPQSFQVSPYASLGLAGRSFYSQLRAGLQALYPVNDFFMAGLMAEGAFVNGSYLSIGPMFTRELPSKQHIWRPSFQFSALYYQFKHQGDSEKGFGVQWALENKFALVTNENLNILPSIRAGFDMMILNMQELRVPFFFSLGTEFRF